MAEIAVAIAAKVAEYLVHPLIHPFTYCCNYKSNLEKLKNEVQKLRDAKESVQHKVDDAKRSGEDIEQRVENWLITAEQILDAAARIIERTEDTTNRLCPNLNTRYQVSKKAAREVKAAAELLQQEGRFDKVSYRTVPEDIWLTSIKGYEAFESRMSTLNDVINALKNPDVHMIGVYGIGGVGKTMLVKEVARQARNDKLFDEVVYADVSQTPDIKKIQGQIADKLGLKFYEESESGRARKLCERLRKEKKILVILDNIWTNLDLENVGIPFGDRGCGVLMTARSQDVLSSKMDCQNNFLVGALNESEAWDLFKKLVGDKIENNDLKAVAVDIAKACGGLPIAIVTIARALRNKNTFEWKNALRELTRPSSSSFSGVPAEAYKSIELSYNHLEGEELKSTFLLCCLMDFIENPSVLYLLSYGMGLDLFKGTHTMEEARDRALTLVDKLKNSCLLLDGPESEYFSVHDVVRDVAISIASRDQHSIAVNNIEAPPRELLDKDTLKNCTAISLHNCKIGELVDGLECPRLKFFHISPREGFIKIPDNFFTRLTELRVLDFTDMHLLSLPSSLHLLVNLRTLCLDNGVLGDVAVIGELKQLEILSFQGSNIEQLPREIGQLTRLRSLNLSSCYQLKAISSNVISNLSQLEELYLGDTFIQWETEGQSSSERSRASLHELKHLSSLNTLEIQVRDPKVLPKGFLSQKLKRYKVFIGDEWNWPDSYENQRILKLKLNASICLKDEFFMQLKGLEELWLDEVQGVENVVYELDREGFPSLKHLHIQNNPYLLCINDSTELVPLDAFPLLESLSLSNLMNLEKISCSQLRAEPFIRLRNLKVESCEKLTHIFSFSISRGLPQLQTIEVIACKSMKHIFVVGREDDINNTEVVDKIEFSQLRKLTLKSLPQLRSFCSVVKNSLQRQQELLASGTLSTEVILDYEPDTNKQFFNEKVAFPNLETLKLSAINSETIWHNQLPAMSSCIQNLTRLIVHGCSNLKYLFSTSLVRSLMQLQHLEIRKCMDLEEIVFPEEMIEEERKDIVLPQLNFLKMKDLAKLTRFCSGNCIELPSLKQLQIVKCPELKAFILQNISTDMTAVGIQPFFNKMVVLPSLEEMVLSKMGNLKMIWHSQFAGESFCKLKLMEVKFCKSLRTIFPHNMFARFLKLESLIVGACGSLQEIFDLQELNSEETHSGAVSRLGKLHVFRLPKLTKIWNKDPRGNLIFQNLVLVRIFECQRLKSVFPTSVAKSLLQLERLSINNCESVEEIVANEGRADEATTKFIFPSSTFLRLRDLPCLTTFYSGMHTLEWPELKKLEIDNVQVFTSECLRFLKVQKGQLDFPAQKPFYLFEKVLSNLEELTLSEHNFTIWQQAQFHKLKVLHVIFDGSAFFQVGLLQNIPNLEKLLLSNCPCGKIFSCGEVEEHAERVARIKSLKLNKLWGLEEHLWRPDSNLNSFLQTLEILEVKKCWDSLINLLPSSASFRNLTVLKVCHCWLLISLVTPQTAKTLVQLRELRVSECHRLEEIVANEGVADDEIVFSKLKWLFLERSDSITSFCSGNYAFSFPSLEALIVENCPKLNTFSAGVLKTPRLRAVQNWELGEDFWAGDVNTTLQHLNEKVAKRRMTEVEYDSETSMSEENEAEEEEENVGGDPSAERPMTLSHTDEDEDEEYEDEEEYGEDDDIHSC